MGIPLEYVANDRNLAAAELGWDRINMQLMEQDMKSVKAQNATLESENEARKKKVSFVICPSLFRCHRVYVFICYVILTRRTDFSS